MINFLTESVPNLPDSRAKVDDVRILHLGKFLDDEQTLRGMFKIHSLLIISIILIYIYIIHIVTNLNSTCFIIHHHDKKTDYNMATGPDNITVVHINIRAPQNASEDMKEKMSKKGNSCCNIM